MKCPGTFLQKAIVEQIIDDGSIPVPQGIVEHRWT